jgi:glycerol-3-phosphate acyltransferase PlsY
MTVLSILTSYILGSLAWGLWIGMLRGTDVRQVGSGNLGATNVARALGKKLGLLVLVLDALKGAVAVLLGRAVASGSPDELAFLPALCGTVAILGHITTPWAGFRGGKGVATGAGVAAVLTPLPFLLALAVFVLVLLTTRFVSLGSILSAVALPFLVLWLGSEGPEGPWLIAWSGLVALLVTGRHLGNVKRLLRGEEPRMGDSKAGSIRREPAP